MDRMSNRVSCRRETARPPPLPLPTENACNFRPMGGIYITRARKTAIRPTELRLYRGRVCACLSLSLSLSTSASKYPLGPTRPTCALELLKFGRTFGGKNKKKRGRKENTVRNKVVSDKVVWLFQVMHHCRDERVNESTGKSTNRSPSIMPA